MTVWHVVAGAMTVMPACRPDEVFAMRADVLIAIVLAKADLVERGTKAATAAAAAGGGSEVSMDQIKQFLGGAPG